MQNKLLWIALKLYICMSQDNYYAGDYECGVSKKF